MSQRKTIAIAGLVLVVAFAALWWAVRGPARPSGSGPAVQPRPTPVVGPAAPAGGEQPTAPAVGQAPPDAGGKGGPVPPAPVRPGRFLPPGTEVSVPPDVLLHWTTQPEWLRRTLKDMYDHAYHSRRVLVKFAAGVPRERGLAVEAGIDAETSQRLGQGASAEMDRWRLVELSSDGRVAEALCTLAESPDVECAEPDWELTVAETIPNDTDFGSLWGLHNTGQSGGTADADIDAPQAWDLATGTDIVVGVIDTGVDWSHPDLAGNIWVNTVELSGQTGIDDDGNGYVDDVRGWDFVNVDNNPTDDHGHGTHVAGTIAGVGNNGARVVGVCWRARIMPFKIFNASGQGGSDSDIVLAIGYATQKGARLTSNSYGGGGFSQAVRDAIEAANQAGILFVAAAGNGGFDQIGDNNDSTPQYPASYDNSNILSVAATTRTDGIASFSNFGATSVDLGAPGVDTLSLAPGGGTATMSGTSMATPHVSGACALLWSRTPGATAAEVRAAILAAVDPVPALSGKCVTGGRLNVFSALGWLSPPGTYAITGRVTWNGNGLSGATVTLSGAANGTRTTGSDGTYSFAGLANGSYAVSASRASFSFSPSSIPVTLSGANASGRDFAGTLTNPLSISGQVTTTSGGLPNVSVRITGAAVATAVTDSSGQYGFSDLLDGSYGVTPTANGYAFSPTSRSVTLTSSNATGVNFSATQVAVSTHTADPNPDLPILDNQTTTSTLVVPAGVGAIADVNVYVDLTHTFIGDLVVSLRSPAGTTVILHNRTGASTQNIRTWYDTETAPAQPLSAFVQEGASGTWTLTVSDQANQDTGALNLWRLELAAAAGPTVAVTPSGTTTNASPITFTLTFSESVTGLSAADVAVANGTKGALGGGPSVYTLPVAPTAQGAVTCLVPAGSAQNAAGTVNSASNTATVTYNPGVPTVAVTPDGTTTNASPIPFTLTFSQPVSGLTAATLVVTNGTKGALSGGPSVYTIPVTPAAQGVVTCQVPAGAAQGAAGIVNSASNTATVTYNASVPTVAVTPDGTTTNASPITFTLTFSQSVSGLTAAAVVVTNGTKGTLAGGPSVYMIPVTPTTQGAVTCQVPAGAAQGAAGTVNSASNTATVTYNASVPTVAVTPDGTTTNASPITFTLTFSQSVSGLTAAALVVTNGTKGALAGGPSVYTIPVTPATQGAVTCQVPAGAAQGAAGSANSPSNTATVTYNTGVPTVTISGRVTAAGAGLAGVALNGSLVPLRTDAQGNYSASFPSGWTGTVTPVLAGYAFSPGSRSYPSVTADQPSQDYAATRATCETVVGLGRGSRGWVRVLGDRASSFAGVGWRQFPWLVYDFALGETRVACGDVDGDGFDEVAVGMGRYAGGGYVAILDDLPHRMAVLKWLRIPDRAYCSANGETWPALGDVDKDGLAEVLIGMGPYPSTVPDVAWRQGPSLPDGRSFMGAVHWDNRVYLVGGTPATGGAASSTVWICPIGADGSPGILTAATSMQVARSGHGVAVWSGRVYAVGGTASWPWPGGGCDYASVEFSTVQPDGALGPWTTTLPMPTPRSTAGVLAYNGFLYVVGGLDSVSSATSSVLSSRINADGTLAGWTETTPLPAPWISMGIAAHDGYMYVVRGSTGGNETDRVLCARIEADGTLGAWTETSPVAGVTRDYSRAVVVDGRLYQIGGEDGGAAFNEVWSAPINADGTLGTWVSEAPLLAGRWTPAVAASGNSIYVFGGWNGGNLTTSEWRRMGGSAGGYVYLYDDASSSHALRLQIRIPASSYRSTSGETRPSTGNLSGDSDIGGREILIAGGRGSQGLCYVFGDAAAGHRFVSSFQGGWPAYHSVNGETWLACGDVVGGSEDEILVGHGRGGRGWMRLISSTAGASRWPRLPWDAYNAAMGETRPSLGDVDGDGRAEIAIGLGTYPADGGTVWFLDDGNAGYASLGRKPAAWPVYNTANGETRPAIGNVR